jgi:hypothetical protein
MADDFSQVFETQVNLDSLVQGNNGSVRRFLFRRSGVVVPLVGGTVEVAILKGETLTKKQATITDASNGVCEVRLTRTDLAESGLYFMQPTVRFDDDDEFSGDVDRFRVTGRLTGAPPVEQPPGEIGNIVVTIDGGEF